jgi:hypothetical protein
MLHELQERDWNGLQETLKCEFWVESPYTVSTLIWCTVCDFPTLVWEAAERVVVYFECVYCWNWREDEKIALTGMNLCQLDLGCVGPLLCFVLLRVVVEFGDRTARFVSTGFRLCWSTPVFCIASGCCWIWVQNCEVCANWIWAVLVHSCVLCCFGLLLNLGTELRGLCQLDLGRVGPLLCFVLLGVIVEFGDRTARFVPTGFGLRWSTPVFCVAWGYCWIWVQNCEIFTNWIWAVLVHSCVLCCLGLVLNLGTELRGLCASEESDCESFSVFTDGGVKQICSLHWHLRFS